MIDFFGFVGAVLVAAWPVLGTLVGLGVLAMLAYLLVALWCLLVG